MGIVRFLLALSVVAFHCGGIFGLKLVGGQIAVQSFYIISGFYMSLILNEKYIGVNNSYGLFMSNRFIRLFPIYWIVLLITIVFCSLAVISTGGASLSKFEGYFSVTPNIFSFAYLIISNIIIFGQDLFMFLGINPENGHLFFTSNFRHTHPQLNSFLFVPQAWTLGLELTFYLLAPFILRRGMGIVTALIVSSLLLRLFFFNYMHFQQDPWTYRFFPTEILFFLSGYLSYRLHCMVKEKPLSKYTNLSALSFILLFTFAYPLLPAVRFSHFPFSLKDSLYFLSIILSIPFLFEYFKKNKLDTQIGELSYPIYISHILILMICSTRYFSLLSNGWTVALLTILFSFLLNKYLAVPMEKYRQSRLLSAKSN